MTFKMNNNKFNNKNNSIYIKIKKRINISNKISKIIIQIFRPKTLKKQQIIEKSQKIW